MWIIATDIYYIENQTLDTILNIYLLIHLKTAIMNTLKVLIVR